MKFVSGVPASFAKASLVVVVRVGMDAHVMVLGLSVYP